MTSRIACRALLAVGLSIGSGAAASAATVFTQDFNDPTIAGTQIVASGTTDGFSDRFGPTNYYLINAVNGFTFTGGAYLAQDAANANDGALLLNENAGTAATTITGLTLGQDYAFSFLLSGDNRPGSAYVLNVAIDGNTTSINGVDGASGANPGTWVSIDFTATGTSAALFLSQASPTQASPIVDDLSVSAIPEPAAWAMMLVGFGLVGYAMRQRARTTVAYS